MSEQLAEKTTDVESEAPPEGPIRVAWAPVPKVNLLPLEIVEGRRFRRTQLMLAGAVVGVALIAGVATFGVQQSIGDANDQLAAAQSKVAELQAEQSKYAAVPKLVAQVKTAEQARALAMGSDVLWYRFLNDLDGARPAGVVFNGLTITMTGTAGTTGTSATSGGAGYSDPLTPVGIGTMTVQGTGQQYDQVASWMEAVNKIAGFSAAKLTTATATKDPVVVTFGSTGVIDSAALSGRYDEKEAG